MQELKRLEDKLYSRCQSYNKKFEGSLGLDDIGYPKNLITGSTLTNSGRLSLLTPQREPKQIPDLPHTTSNPKLMRTPSTEDLGNLQPVSKWQSLFKMFREWKQQTNIAKGQYLTLATPKPLDELKIEEEIIQLRSAIHSLRQRKRLSPSDQKLLETLQKRLKRRIEEKSEAHKQSQ